jgi:nicotinate-nucleotide--dimethylbenzimidazole phosphoribosyltransferase
MQSFLNIAQQVKAPSELWQGRARAHLDTLTKPLGSLGRLEDLAAQMIAIRQDRCATGLRKAVYVFAADHGITAAGISAYPREVTHQMVLNFLREGAAINVLARLHRAALTVVDVGVDADFNTAPGLLRRKVARGSRNMLREPAMTEQELSRAFEAGVEAAADADQAGFTMVAVGEMGIGNTTSASTMTCAITAALPEQATGRGTGLNEASYQHKIDVVRSLGERYFTGPQPHDPLHILRCVGGLEIAAMVGMIVAAASRRQVVLIDGFISTAAAAIAVAVAPDVRGYLIAGHRSEEPGHKLLLDHLKLTPVLSLAMRLGEGTGAVLAMPILESALALYNQMATFSSAGVSEAS